MSQQRLLHNSSCEKSTRQSKTACFPVLAIISPARLAQISNIGKFMSTTTGQPFLNRVTLVQNFI